MTTYLLTAAIFILFMLALGLGVMAGRGAIRGSCGGVGAGGCAVCSRGRCRRRRDR